MEPRPTEFERKFKLKEQILDDVLPFTENMTPEQIEQRDIERQKYVLDLDLGSMSVAEIEHVIIEHVYTLPVRER